MLIGLEVYFERLLLDPLPRTLLGLLERIPRRSRMATGRAGWLSLGDLEAGEEVVWHRHARSSAPLLQRLAIDGLAAPTTFAWLLPLLPMGRRLRTTLTARVLVRMLATFALSKLLQQIDLVLRASTLTVNCLLSQKE